MQIILPSCGICFIDFKSGDSDSRPISLNCGHSTCHRCFLTLQCCPLCKRVNESQLINPQGLNASPNYMLDEICRDDPQLLAKQQDKVTIKSTNYCFDCEEIYKPVDFSFVNVDPHEEHETLDLSDKDPELLADFLWAKQNSILSIKHKGSWGNLVRACTFLLNNILEATKSFNVCFKLDSDNIYQSADALLKEGLDSPKIVDKHAMSKIRTLRKLEQMLVGPILLSMKEFGTDEFSKLIKPQLKRLVQQNKISKVLNKLKIPKVEYEMITSLVKLLNAANDEDSSEDEDEPESEPQPAALGKRVPAPKK